MWMVEISKTAKKKNEGKGEIRDQRQQGKLGFGFSEEQAANTGVRVNLLAGPKVQISHLMNLILWFQ